MKALSIKQNLPVSIRDNGGEFSREKTIELSNLIHGDTQ